MSTGSIYHYLSEAGNTGSWKIYYDFNNYDGDYVVNSSPEATGSNSAFSGYIGGNTSSFKTTKPGSGYFNNNYLEVTSGHTLFGANKAFTMLVSQTKTDNTCGTLFSNYKGDMAPTSGWEFGINNANKLYFKNYESWRPNISTLNITPTAKNYYFLGGAASQIIYARYLPEVSGWANGGKGLNSNYFLNNTGWFLGSVEYNYAGYIDEFFYFDELLTFADATNIIKSSHQSLQTGLNYATGTISGLTGFQAFPTGATGTIYTTGVLSGYVTESGSGSQISGEALTGAVSSGDRIYTLITTVTGNTGAGVTGLIDIYRGTVATGTDTGPGIVTGFVTGYSGFFTTGQPTAFYVSSGVTGVLWTGSGYTPLSGTPSGFVISGAESELTGTMPNDYKADTLSYLGQRCGPSGDFVEYIHTADIDNINLIPYFGYLSDFKGEGVRLTKSGNATELNLISNGVTQLSGEPTQYTVNPGTITPNPWEVIQSTESGNYFLSGHYVISTGLMTQRGDQVIFDIGQSGSRGRKDITALADYASAPFSEIDASAQVFFNGQKIYSGIDYTDAAGFNPLSPLTTMTGTYFSAPNFSDSVVYSGVNRYDLTGDAFSGNSHVIYINGVRQSPDSFVGYSSGVSLLVTGQNIIEESLPILYNIRPRKWRIKRNG